MFGAARLQRIREVIAEKKHIDVSTLSSMLSVTEVTIRKDLEKLESEGFIIKTHGGAILNGDHTNNISSAVDIHPAAQYDENKSTIGTIAAHLIKEGEYIFVGPGTTCYYVALALKDKKNINIVTNNISVVNALANNSSINVIVTGGNLQGNSMTLTGEVAINMLEGIFIDKAIISVTGVHIDNGYTISNMDDINIYRTIINISKELIIVADGTKFDKTSFIKLGNLDIAKKVVTNENVPREFKAYFFQKGIQIFTSYEIEN